MCYTVRKTPSRSSELFSHLAKKNFWSAGGKDLMTNLNPLRLIQACTEQMVYTQIDCGEKTADD